jgi:ubiquinone/menaquinone biosynthesis C-methylase UbiE
MTSMSVETLRERLQKIEAITDEQWLRSLDERKRKELEFHDRDRSRESRKQLDQDTYEKFYGNERYYGTVQRSEAYTTAWIQKHARGRVFLDYACGNGTRAIQAAKEGASLALGLDISRVSVENAKIDAEKAGVTANTCFFQADAENTKLPNDSVDTVICSGMLHHLDLSYAFPELRRILAPGGRILAVEALDYNPAIKVYRQLTPSMRTDWEKAHILSLKDVEFARRFFSVGEVRYWHITSYLGAHAKPLLPLLEKIDAVLTKIPLVQRIAWIFTFELIKPGGHAGS